MTATELRDAALLYAARGWSVIPVGRVASKLPLQNWKHLQDNRSNQDQICRWWERSRHNIGIVTGAISGIIVLDVDSEDGYREIEAHGGLPLTLSCSTGKGRHYYFLHPGFIVHNFARKLPGLDLRGDGGYVLAPPSQHQSGKLYQWDDEAAPVAPAPQWLLDLLEREVVTQNGHATGSYSTASDHSANGSSNGHRINGAQVTAYVRAAMEGELRALQTTPEGARNNQLFKSGCSLLGLAEAGACDPLDVLASLEIAARSVGLADHEIKTTLRSARERTAGRPRALPESNAAPVVVLRGKAARSYIVGDVADDTGAGDDDGEDDDGNGDDDDGNGETASDDPDEAAVNNGLYVVQNGRTLLSVSKEKHDTTGSSSSGQRGFVWDGAACITGEMSDEDGTTVFEIEGRTISGRSFRFDLEASKLSDQKVVRAAVHNFAGAESVIYAGMEKHLAPSIQSFTDYRKLRHWRRFRRVGWTKNGREFIIPGLEPPDVVMALSKDLAYRVEAPSNPHVLSPEASQALTSLLQSHRIEFTALGLCHVLLAPLAHLCGWRDDKFGLFIASRTGSFKTAVASMLMCLYGDFANEDRLLKFSLGGTNLALMSYTADAGDVPLLIDNFKPGIGGGQKEAQNLINGVLEGGEKKRLNRDGSRREPKDIRCWPIFTGEDTIDDAASVARTLIISARWEGGTENRALTATQSMAHVLPQVGGAWLSWLMRDEAQIVADYVKSQFYPRRARWTTDLREVNPDMVNASRIASSLALCECAWEAALGCSYLEPIIAKHDAGFKAGLKEVAGGMGGYAAQSHEANRYLAALRAMLTANRAYLLDKMYDPDKDDRRTFLGWQDDQYVYLHPDNAFHAALEYLQRSGGLNGLGMNTIHRQLEQLGFLARKDGTHMTVAQRVGRDRKQQRLLWLRQAVLFDDEETDEDDGGEDGGE